MNEGWNDISGDGYTIEGVGLATDLSEGWDL